MASEKLHSWIDYIILIITPVVIFITILIGVDFSFDNDYIIYEQIWIGLLNGQNPYVIGCAYPIGFLGFGGLYYFYSLLPKVFFCLIWLATGVMINKFCKKYDISDINTLRYIGFIMLNPLYFMAVVVMGRYDVVVGLCVLLTIFCIDNSEQIKSGIYAALAFLLKFVGLILIFPVVFTKKKINWRFGITAVFICGGIYLLGFIFWGSVVFDPFITHLLRTPGGASIFLFIEEIFGIDLSFLIIYILFIITIIAIIFLYYKNNDVATYSLIIIICFTLILPVFFAHYALWFIPLAIYWTITHGNLLIGISFLYFSGLFSLFTTPFFQDYINSLFNIVFLTIFVIYIYLNRKKDEIDEKIKNNINSFSNN